LRPCGDDDVQDFFFFSLYKMSDNLRKELAQLPNYASSWPTPNVSSTAMKGLLAPSQPDYSLYSIPHVTKNSDINRQLLYKQALKQILFDNKPSKEDFATLQRRALEDLTTIASWVEGQPDMKITEEILAILDPRKVKEAGMKCFQRGKGAPSGLPRASCALKGVAQRSEDGRYYVSDGSKWIYVQGWDKTKHGIASEQQVQG
jgi:hypothetical protein